jgi:hypothetical protein
VSRWPADGIALRAELSNSPGRLLFLVGDGADGLASDLARVWDGTIASVGGCVASAEERSVLLDAAALVAAGDILTDLDAIFWEPALHLEVLTLLRGVARRRAVAVVWPGAFDRGVLRYSEPGRRDFYEARLEDAIVLKARAGTYPGEVPYTMERVAG